MIILLSYLLQSAIPHISLNLSNIFTQAFFCFKFSLINSFPSLSIYFQVLLVICILRFPIFIKFILFTVISIIMPMSSSICLHVPLVYPQVLSVTSSKADLKTSLINFCRYISYSDIIKFLDLAAEITINTVIKQLSYLFFKNNLSLSVFTGWKFVVFN